MTQEDKELLVRDLCARLPYGVKAHICIEDSSANVHAGFIDTIIDLVYDIINEEYSVEGVKPYLFPISSMTEEQREEYQKTTGYFNSITIKSIDWLNAHHFDYRNLIEKSLAIDATNLNIY